MKRTVRLADGLYRLVKVEEDHNPVFPNRETVVEIRDGNTITNISTGRAAAISVLGESRVLYGPLEGPYDLRPVTELQRVALLELPAADEPYHQDAS